jgi:hypothetical protein
LADQYLIYSIFTTKSPALQSRGWEDDKDSIAMLKIEKEALERLEPISGSL